MIKVSNSILVIALLLACTGVASAAAPASRPPTMKALSCSGAAAQLLASASGGADALAAIDIAIPSAALAGGLHEVGTYDVSRADIRIKAMAASALKAGDMPAAQLFSRLANEGTPKEKMEFMHAQRKPYAFPARFRSIFVRTGICREVAKTFCVVSCIHTGTAQEKCQEDCKDIFVTLCD